MLRLLGIACLTVGCTGLGWCWKDRLKKGLEEQYQVWRILKMMENEITYSRAPLPEACLRIAARVQEPYREAFAGIHREMTANCGAAFDTVWRGQMEKCTGSSALPAEEKKRLLELGNCVGFMDGQMQAHILEQQIRRLELSIGKQEKEMADKGRVIMSLSIMGGVIIGIIFI